MKFFKKTSVAILITALLVALCCVWGYARAYESAHAHQLDANQSMRAGENSLNYFLNWIDDDAELFSMETTDTLARNNLVLNSNYGSLLAIKSVFSLNENIETYAKNLFQTLQLSNRDFLLVLDRSSYSWYLVYGSQLRQYADGNTALADLMRAHLTADFFQGGSDEGILALFDDLEDWCTQNLPELDASNKSNNPFLQNYNDVPTLSLKDILMGILFTLLVNIWWIILLLVVLNLIDRHRFQKYIAAYPPVEGLVPPVFFRPLLFWHRHGSAWYYRMLDLITGAADDSEEPDGFQDDGNGPFDGGAASGSAGAQDGPYTGSNAGPGPQDGPYTGPGPDVGPHTAGFSGGFGFQGNPEEAFRQQHHRLLNLWRSTCRFGWSTLRRFLGGRRF